MNLFKGFCLFLLLAATPALARDLAGRVGFGYANQFSNDTPSLSLKYGLTKDMSVSALAGFNTALPTQASFGGKVFRNLFYEPNINFYGALGMGYVKGALSTGVEILALLGAEFFIPGLESLGFSFEAGASINNVSGSFSLKTVGFSFLHAGTHFYF